ncbi:MAG: flavodoxin [Planctomycetota bacterium]
MKEPEILIAFYSHSGNNYVGGNIVNLRIGNTEAAAGMIEKLTGGKLFKIDTEKAYSADYTEATEVAQKELRQNARPVLRSKLDKINDCNTVILGYPNWWGTMPMAVCTFLESCDFSGKTILPFCTHEGSGLGRSENDIKRLCPGSKVLSGLSVVGGNVKHAEKDIERWLKKTLPEFL